MITGELMGLPRYTVSDARGGLVTGASVAWMARRWLDTPYKHGACKIGVGVDCIGVVVGVALSMGLPEAEAFASDADFKGYSRQPDPAKLLQACDRYLDRIAAPELGSIAVMRFKREPQHFGIISSIDPIRIIHAYQDIKFVREHGLEAKWPQRIIRHYRFRGVNG